jgi:hypothetical protein
MSPADSAVASRVLFLRSLAPRFVSPVGSYPWRAWELAPAARGLRLVLSLPGSRTVHELSAPVLSLVLVFLVSRGWSVRLSLVFVSSPYFAPFAQGLVSELLSGSSYAAAVCRVLSPASNQYLVSSRCSLLALYAGAADRAASAPALAAC